MKTLHRLMYENLTPEEWKIFCRVPAKRLNSGVFSHDYTHDKPCKSLIDSFAWQKLEEVMELKPGTFCAMALRLQEKEEEEENEQIKN